MAGVLLKDLTKKFGKVMAVNNMNLTINEGEFFVLLGPSGCGKSTTLNLIAGLETPDKGEIYIGDRLVNDTHPKDRKIAMVFQDYALYPHMKVYDNMAFGLRMRKVPKDEIDKRVRRAARLLGIEELLDRKPYELSGGQKQRTAVGRAIVRSPDVFLFDEPLSNLDAKLRARARVELKKLHRKLKTTTIYVTHDQVEAMTLGDVITVMKDAEIQQVGTASELHNHPANMFVAGFIGSPSMNLIPCKLMKRGDHFYFNVGSFEVRIPDETSTKLTAELEERVGQEVIMGIRPANIHDKEFAMNATSENTFGARVSVAERLGDRTILHLDIGEHSLVATVNLATKAKEGDELEVVFDLDKTHLFDKSTEKAIF